MGATAERDSAPAAEEEALLVHSRAYLDTLKAVSDVVGGELGMAAAQPRRPD